MKHHHFPPSRSLDPLKLRQALGSFVTGVTVVTVHDTHETPRGLTANSFTSVSMDPPLILVCIGRHAASHPVFARAAAFAVSVLRVEQKALSRLFASKAESKFKYCKTFTAVTGTPIIESAISWFDCTVHQSIQIGDHLVLIGEIRAFDQSAGIPLAYCQGNYVDVDFDPAVARTDRLAIRPLTND